MKLAGSDLPDKLEQIYGFRAGEGESFRKRMEKMPSHNPKIWRGWGTDQSVKTSKMEVFLKNVPPGPTVSFHRMDSSTHCQINPWVPDAARSEREMGQVMEEARVTLTPEKREEIGQKSTFLS